MLNLPKSTLFVFRTIECAGNLEELQAALPYLEWCGKNALPSGVLAELARPGNCFPLCVLTLT